MRTLLQVEELGQRTLLSATPLAAPEAADALVAPPLDSTARQMEQSRIDTVHALTVFSTGIKEHFDADPDQEQAFTDDIVKNGVFKALDAVKNPVLTINYDGGDTLTLTMDPTIYTTDAVIYANGKEVATGDHTITIGEGVTVLKIEATSSGADGQLSRYIINSYIDIQKGHPQRVTIEVDQVPDSDNSGGSSPTPWIPTTGDVDIIGADINTSGDPFVLLPVSDTTIGQDPGVGDDDLSSNVLRDLTLRDDLVPSLGTSLFSSMQEREHPSDTHTIVFTDLIEDNGNGNVAQTVSHEQVETQLQAPYAHDDSMRLQTPVAFTAIEPDSAELANALITPPLDPIFITKAHEAMAKQETLDVMTLAYATLLSGTLLQTEETPKKNSLRHARLKA